MSVIENIDYISDKFENGKFPLKICSAVQYNA
jgi:hypothetical protein